MTMEASDIVFGSFDEVEIVRGCLSHLGPGAAMTKNHRMTPHKTVTVNRHAMLKVYPQTRRNTFAHLLEILYSSFGSPDSRGRENGADGLVRFRPEQGRRLSRQGNGPNPLGILRLLGSSVWLRERPGGSETSDRRPQTLRLERCRRKDPVDAGFLVPRGTRIAPGGGQVSRRISEERVSANPS